MLSHPLDTHAMEQMDQLTSVHDKQNLLHPSGKQEVLSTASTLTSFFMTHPRMSRMFSLHTKALMETFARREKPAVDEAASSKSSPRSPMQSTSGLKHTGKHATKTAASSKSFSRSTSGLPRKAFHAKNGETLPAKNGGIGAPGRYVSKKAAPAPTFAKPSMQDIHKMESEAMHPMELQQIPMLAKCISFIMKRGQKAKAATTMNTVLKMLQDLAPQNKKVADVLDMLHVAINNVKPSFELRKARFGGRTQFIPATMKVHKQENMALRTIMQNARTKHKKASITNKHHDMYTFAYFLAQEIHDAYKHQGAACQAKQTTHKQAEHNRNHVRRRWW